MSYNFRRYNSYGGTPSGYGGAVNNSYSSGSSSFGGRSFGYGSVGSDTSSVRSFGSSRGYGSASIGSLKSSFEPTPRYSSYDHGGSSGGYKPSMSRRPSMDRSLSYAALNAGAVSSIKDRFDSRPSSTPSRERYSSLDRFSGGHSGGRESGSRGGYGSDADVASSRSYGSYGRPSSSYFGRDYRREASREPSPSRYSRAMSREPSPPRYGRLSRPDYGSSMSTSPRRTAYGGHNYMDTNTKSYGSDRSYGSGSSSKPKWGGGGYNFGSSYLPDYKSKASVLTPFEPRRSVASRTNEPSLTPFSNRYVRSNSQTDVSRPTYDRQSSERSARPLERQPSRDLISRHEPIQNKEEPRKKKWIPDEELSSDSCEEPTDIRKRKPNVIYLTSRATSPMEIDRQGLNDEISKTQKQRRRRLISRTKTKEYSRKNYKRRREKPMTDDICLQVDTDEMDKLSGRVRFMRNRFRDKIQENRNNLYGTKTSGYGASQSRPSSGYSSYATKPERVTEKNRERHSSEASKESESQRIRRQQGPLSPQRSEPLPKQSAFKQVPRPARPRVEPDIEYQDTATDLETHQGSQWEEEGEEEDDYVPEQSSFLERRRRHEEQKAADNEVVALTPENLSLKETIDKVKCWKKQLQRTPPETPVPKESAMSPKSRSYHRQRSRTNSGSRGRQSSIESGPPSRQQSGEQILSDDDSNDDVYQRRTSSKSPNITRYPEKESGQRYHERPKRQISFEREQGFDNDYQQYSNQRNAPRIKVEDTEPRYHGSSSHGYPAKSTDSMASFGDESSMVSDDEPMINRAHSMASLSQPKRFPSNRTYSMDSLNRNDKSTSVTSLPDLIENTQRRGPYISHSIKDIDSFLDFDETEDDPDLWSDDEMEQMKKNKANHQQRESTLERSQSPDSDIEEIVPEVHIETEAERLVRVRKRCLPSWMSDMLPRSNKERTNEKSFISDYKNIDDYFDPDIVEEGIKFVRSESIDQTKALHLDIPTSPVVENFGSCASIMDAPVPETPDVPLAPKPVFGFPVSPTADNLPNSQSVDNLDAIDPDGKLSLKRLAKKKSQIDKTRSVGNLDDLDSILNTLSSSPSLRRKNKLRDESSTFELFTRDAKDDLKKEVEEIVESPESKPEFDLADGDDILVDVSDVNTPLSPSAFKDPYEDGVYPVDYSSEAVRQAIILELEKGTITTTELCAICKKEVPKKPPWIIAEEDRSFTGFRNIDALLESLGVDVKKVAVFFFLQICSSYEFLD